MDLYKRKYILTQKNWFSTVSKITPELFNNIISEKSSLSEEFEDLVKNSINIQKTLKLMIGHGH